MYNMQPMNPSTADHYAKQWAKTTTYFRWVRWTTAAAFGFHLFMLLTWFAMVTFFESSPRDYRQPMEQLLSVANAGTVVFLYVTYWFEQHTAVDAQTVDRVARFPWSEPAQQLLRERMGDDPDKKLDCFTLRKVARRHLETADDNAASEQAHAALRARLTGNVS